MLVFSDGAELEKLWSVISNSMEQLKLYYMLLAAVKLSLFDAVESPKSVSELSCELSCEPLILEGLCNALVEVGFLRKDEDRYVNTSVTSRYLTKRSPFSVCDAIESFSNDISIWAKLSELLKEGPFKLSKGEFFARHVIHRMCVEAMCGELQKTLDVVCSISAFRNVRRMLDIGGGHGIYTVGFALANPEMRGYIFDLPEVAREAKRYIERFELGNRVHVLSGDFFKDDIGKGYDMVFSSYNPGGKNPEVVKKIYNALNDGGMFVSKQSFPVDGRDKSSIDELWWYMWTVDGMKKDRRMYSFKGDVSLEGYVDFLEGLGFKAIRVEDFSNADKLVVARKGGKQ